MGSRTETVTPYNPLSTDHLRFTPSNPRSRRAFNEIAQTITSRRLSKEHHISVHLQSHVYVEPRTPVAPDSTGPESKSTSNDLPHFHEGYFRLNLVHFAPRNLRKGDGFGSTRLGKKKENRDLDVALTWNSARDGVKHHHFYVVYNKNSLKMILTPAPGRKVTINGKQYTYDQPYHIRDESVSLTVGKLAYTMQYIASPNSGFSQTLAKLFKTVEDAARSAGNDDSVPKASDSFTSAVSDTGVDLGPWHITGPEPYGTYGALGSCFKNESCADQSYGDKNYKVGHELAVKRVLRTSQNFESIKNEIDILLRFRRQPHLCFLVDAIFTSGTKDTSGPGPVCDVWLVLDPFPRKGSLRQVLNDRPKGPAPINRNEMIRWTLDALRGLWYMHTQLEKPLIHRNIKPESCLIQTSNKGDYLVISDFSHATFETGSRDIRKGTRKYHPPELRQRKDLSGLSIDCWTPAADIWSLGLVALEMRGRVLPDHVLDPRSHHRVLGELPDDDEFSRVLYEMLSWLPEPMAEHPARKGRWNVSQLLENPIFNDPALQRVSGRAQ